MNSKLLVMLWMSSLDRAYPTKHILCANYTSSFSHFDKNVIIWICLIQLRSHIHSLLYTVHVYDGTAASVTAWRLGCGCAVIPLKESSHRHFPQWLMFPICSTPSVWILYFIFLFFLVLQLEMTHHLFPAANTNCRSSVSHISRYTANTNRFYCVIAAGIAVKVNLTAVFWDLDQVAA